jgi:trk system potassium uptake protein TrkH
MIRSKGIAHILGRFLVILAAIMLIPALLGWVSGWGGVAPLFTASAIIMGAGLVLFALFRPPSSDLSSREGILLTVCAWFSLALLGALPFFLSPQFASFTDAVFETASGFTTTGATILPDVEVLPPALQFWRHFTHWVGGMGIVLLGIAVLPLIGAGGMALYRAEFSGARSEKLKPRLVETAISLWRIYLALTLVEYFLLRLAGFNSFDAICHAFSTLGTGGFSTRTASVGGFANPAAEYIIAVFMVLAAVNFTRHYRLWMERDVRGFWRDFEVRGIFTLIGAATAVVFLALLWHEKIPPEHAFRAALFQVASIGSTTGFATADYEKWAPITHAILFALMFIGGCTGSTAGGWKVSRVLLMGRLVYREFKRTSERHGVFVVRLGGQVIPEQTIQSLLNLVYLSLLVMVTAILILAGTGVDLLTSISAVVAAIFSIGPGFGTVGPAENYSHLPALAKWVLSLCMIAGRLEFYTLIVVFTPAFWRK